MSVPGNLVITLQMLSHRMPVHQLADVSVGKQLGNSWVSIQTMVKHLVVARLVVFDHLEILFCAADLRMISSHDKDSNSPVNGVAFDSRALHIHKPALLGGFPDGGLWGFVIHLCSAISGL